MPCTCVQSYEAPGNVKFTEQQIQALWVQAGGNPQAAAVAAAIAMLESGGNSTATCVNGPAGNTSCSCNGCVDRGLWQIDSVHGSQSTYDPMGNARAAVAISGNGTNWGAWGNDYQKVTASGVPPYNPDGSAPINATNAAANQTQAQTTGLTFSPTSWLDPFSWFNSVFTGGDPVDQYIAKTIQGLVIAVLNPFINIVAGVGGVVAGGAMVTFGIFVIVSNTQTGQAAERTAGRAAAAGMSLYAPETAATTQYVGREGQVTEVTQHRRAPGAVRVGGQRVQYRPGTVRTEVRRPRSTRDTINDQARTYRREPA